MFKALNYLWDLVVGWPKIVYIVCSEEKAEVWLHMCRYMPYEGLNLDNQKKPEIGCIWPDV